MDGCPLRFAFTMLRILAPILLITLCGSAARQAHRAPTPVEATDASFPTIGPVVSVVSLLATVDSDGHISETKVLDSIGSTSDGERYQGTLIGYVEDSIAAVKRWRFSPAIDSSSLKPTRSLTSISFLYDRVFGTGTILPIMRTRPAQSFNDMPPLPSKVWRADYPVNSIGIGTVVLKLRIEVSGSISDVEVIKSVPSLDEPSINAVRKWQFQPARHDGKPVGSTTVVAFVFLPL